MQGDPRPTHKKRAWDALPQAAFFMGGAGITLHLSSAIIGQAQDAADLGGFLGEIAGPRDFGQYDVGAIEDVRRMPEQWWRINRPETMRS